MTRVISVLLNLVRLSRAAGEQLSNDSGDGVKQAQEYDIGRADR